MVLDPLMFNWFDRASILSTDELAVYEYWLARTFFGLVAERRLKLPSGEQVVAVDDGGRDAGAESTPGLVEWHGRLYRRRDRIEPNATEPFSTRAGQAPVSKERNIVERHVAGGADRRALARREGGRRNRRRPVGG